MFTTHHNFRIYAVELGEVTYATLKENDHYGQWQYIGFTGEEIYFAARDFQNKSTGWSVKGFTSKASPLMGYLIYAPAVKSILIENIGFGLRGAITSESKQREKWDFFHTSMVNFTLPMPSTEIRGQNWCFILWNKRNGPK